MKDREKHKIGLAAYKKHVKEIEDWYDEMKVRQATTPQALDSVAELQQQLLENRVSYQKKEKRQKKSLKSISSQCACGKLSIVRKPEVHPKNFYVVKIF